jgi:hypothetical protein
LGGILNHYIALPEYPASIAVDTINRSALSLKPAQLFLNWLHQVDPKSAHSTLDDLQREPTIYLVLEYDGPDQAI